MSRRLVCSAQLGGGEQPAMTDDCKLNPRIRRAGARFVPHHMSLVADDHLIARPGQELEPDLVGHRAARDKECRLLAEQFGDALLQPVDRRILAILVVTDRRARHRCTHPLGWERYRVGTQIDAVHVPILRK